MPNGRRRKRVRVMESLKRYAQHWKATRKPRLPKGVRVVGRLERFVRGILPSRKTGVVTRKTFRIKVRARRR